MYRDIYMPTRIIRLIMFSIRNFFFPPNLHASSCLLVDRGFYRPSELLQTKELNHYKNVCHLFIYLTTKLSPLT